MSSQPNTKRVSVSFAVPRDPTAYRLTTHFGQMAKERLPDEDRAEIIRRLIETGHCYGTVPPQAVEDQRDVTRYFAFEDAVFGTEYRLVVGLRPVAFKQATPKHLAVTVMVVTDDE